MIALKILVYILPIPPSIIVVVSLIHRRHLCWLFVLLISRHVSIEKFFKLNFFIKISPHRVIIARKNIFSFFFNAPSSIKKCNLNTDPKIQWEKIKE